MRRGHASVGGWRNENSRHFKPRIGGPPQFRTTRSYHLHDSIRIAPPVPTHFRDNPFGNLPPLMGAPPPEHHDRNKYRIDHRQPNQYRPHHGRPLLPTHGHMRHEAQDNPGAHQMYNENKGYNDSSCSETFIINSMGDVDHRKPSDFIRHQESLSTRRSTRRWNTTPDEKKNYIEDRNNYKPHKYHDNADSHKIPPIEYTGHRPPSSDHYGGNPNPTLENSNSFSRSIDDTVDIIRKRLQNRKEPQQHLEEQRDGNNELDNQIPDPTSSNYQDIQPIQPVKRKIQRQNMNVNVEANCGKMKNKIVHELFKMDKDKIHKLMDNPNSSSKFEYALSSLITESQNSLNRHLRSVAEKSLCSSEAFIHNDNNTIYEDTFMKQMQGILDPQDTVFLEDIKPLVLAELSKVLQLEEYDQTFQFPEDEPHCSGTSNLENYDSYNNYNYENYSHSDYYEQILSPQTAFDEDYDNTANNINSFIIEADTSNPLFERRAYKLPVEQNAERSFGSGLRRHSRSSVDTGISKEDSFSHEKHHSRRSLDNKISDSDHSQPLFDNKAEEISEEDDPFAELDRQYHVAVDPNFIDTYDISSPQQSTTPVPRTSNSVNELNNRDPQNVDNDIIKDIDAQLLNIAKSPLKLVPTTSFNIKTETTENKTETISSNIQIKQETIKDIDPNDHIINTGHECSIESRNEEDLQYRSELTLKSTPLTNSRKRSIDQKPSHRKEKRKKSNSISADPLDQTVRDYAFKDKSPDEVSSSSSRTNSSKEPLKETKKKDTVDKNYSDKYVKRKENQKKNEKAEGPKNRQRSLSSSQSIVSPKENSNNNNKLETKNKLQTIDMFVELPKKGSVHQAHRNTALPPSTPLKTIEVIKPQVLTTFNRKVTKKHVSTQVIRKVNTKETQTLKSKSASTRYCQTEKIKTWSKSVQTDPVIFEKNPSKATDAFERMKEIDMEIQALLQEKFKLYNSLESNSPYPSTIQTLGMTVLNVPNELKDSEDAEIDSLTEDTIVDDFTSIPVEELEQIALETVEEQNNYKKQNKKTRRQKVLTEERANSSSPTTRRIAKKVKTPNISLIEQIITDDRPLEDIISLDDLETTPVKNKKLQTIPKRKVAKKNKAPKKLPTNLPHYNLKKCSVVLSRDDISKYLKSVPDESLAEPDIQEVFEEPITPDPSVVHMQFDMLDVSEDIVIGDVCEVKSDDKDLRTEDIISEEVILDNSQCSDVQTDLNQGENICKVYDYSSDENLRRDSITVSGHADAVLAIESIENNFIAACLDGNVYYFTGEGQLLSTLKGSNLAVTCITIVKEKYGTTVYTGSLDSRIRYYDLETGLEKGPECNVLSPIQTMDRAWDTIFVGTRTGFVLQFECKNNMLIPVSTVKFSEQSILALRAMKEGPRKVLLVAARSEDVTIKDAQTGLLLRTLQGPKMTVYTLLYEDGKIYCGTSSNQIHVFDYASGSHSGVHEGGKGAVCLRATGGLVFAGCYDGCVYVYREGEPRPRAQLRGPSLMLLSLAIVGTKIIAGYKDRSLYIWKIPLSILQEMIL